MALVTGDNSASSGMAKAIYDVLNSEIINNLHVNTPTSVKAAMIQSHKKLAYCIAKGVIDHIKSNMEVKGVKCKLDTGLNTVFTAGVPIPMDGGLALQTAWKLATIAGAADHSTQENDGTGLVE